MTLWKLAGFSMLILMAGLQVIPQEVLEAATVDGASRQRQWLSIRSPYFAATSRLSRFRRGGQLPGIRPVLQLMTHGVPGSSTVSAVYYIYNTSFVNFNLGYGATLSVIVMVILLAFSVVQLTLLRGRGEE